MGRVQQHRGPDSFGTAVAGNVGFVHNRLSIIDLSEAGNQPYRDGSHLLAFNGEIYNYAQLRTDLVRQGVQFAGGSDTEVLFHLLVRHGVPATLRVIRGMFAFSFWDERDRTLYLCRDRFGIKPLVWCRSGGNLYWASEVKALMQAGVGVRPDPVRTLHSLAGIGDQSNEYTVFAGVRHVAPGTYLACKAGAEPRSTEYYNVCEQVDRALYEELDRASAQEITERFDQLMHASVEAMLMSDAPMGAFVSGGIDSSYIASLACAADGNLTLFTANVLGKHSEYEDAKAVSAELGRPLLDAKFEPAAMIEGWAKATYHYECPLVKHTNAVPLAAVATLARDSGVKAVLTGEGSDELFLGYPKLLTSRYQRPLRIPVELLTSLYGIVPGLRSYLFPQPGDSVSDFLGLLTQGFERQRLRDPGMAAYGFLPEKEARRHYTSIQMLREHLLSLLHRNDRMGMLASIESRFPFLDEDVVRFAVNLPLRFKCAWTRRLHDVKHPFLIDKAVVRRAAGKHLPHRLASKRKEGFPMYGHKAVEVSRGYFADGYVADLLGLTPTVEEHMLRTQPRYFIAKLVSLEVFGRLFERGEAPDVVSAHLSTHARMIV